jgi:hypothetical protein
MHDVQTRIRLGAPATIAWTVCKLMFQRLLVMLWAWLTRFPNFGPRIQISHTFAIFNSSYRLTLMRLAQETRLPLFEGVCELFNRNELKVAILECHFPHGSMRT